MPPEWRSFTNLQHIEGNYKRDNAAFDVFFDLQIHRSGMKDVVRLQKHCVQLWYDIVCQTWFHRRLYGWLMVRLWYQCRLLWLTWCWWRQDWPERMVGGMSARGRRKREGGLHTRGRARNGRWLNRGRGAAGSRRSFLNRSSLCRTLWSVVIGLHKVLLEVAFEMVCMFYGLWCTSIYPPLHLLNKGIPVHCPIGKIAFFFFLIKSHFRARTPANIPQNPACLKPLGPVN